MQKPIYKYRLKRSLCRRKRPLKCTRVRGCKVANGTKRSYCRKKRARRLTQKSRS